MWISNGRFASDSLLDTLVLTWEKWTTENGRKKWPQRILICFKLVSKDRGQPDETIEGHIDYLKSDAVVNTTLRRRGAPPNPSFRPQQLTQNIHNAKPVQIKPKLNTDRSQTVSSFLNPCNHTHTLVIPHIHSLTPNCSLRQTILSWLRYLDFSSPQINSASHALCLSEFRSPTNLLIGGRG